MWGWGWDRPEGVSPLPYPCGGDEVLSETQVTALDGGVTVGDVPQALKIVVLVSLAEP